MRKLFLLVSIICCHAIVAQDKIEDKAFNFGPMFRAHGFLPINLGDNYLAESNKSQISFGGNLSLFEFYKFRLAFGFDHAFYKTEDLYLAADVMKTRNTSYYFIVTYQIPIMEHLSVEPYLGGGWSETSFKRPHSTFTNSDATIAKQRGSEFRGGFYLDYKVDKMVSVFTGVGYVGSDFKVNTVPELKDYFGKAQTIQLSIGLKFGYTMNDKRRDKAAAQNK